MGFAVIMMNDATPCTSGCSSTAMAADACGTPAARRASTARRVNSDAHTSPIRSATTSGLSAGTFKNESYSPAADMPARSSTLADERTASELDCSIAAAARSAGSGARAERAAV